MMMCKLEVGAGVGIDFHADRNLDDPRCFPSHGRTPFQVAPAMMSGSARLCQGTSVGEVPLRCSVAFDAIPFEVGDGTLISVRDSSSMEIAEVTAR
jgi:hypothetical protein